jgi:MFS family permease
MPDQLPPKIHNAYWFQAFNAVSWQIVLGSPLILFARELGASAAVLGLLAGMAPLTSTIQLLVAPHAEKIGYRKLMLSGWSGRVATQFLLILLPISVLWISPPVVIGLLVLIIFVFTTLRGVATCSWLPWITALVPRSLRGVYLSRDRTFVSVASVAALGLAGFFMFAESSMIAHSIVYAIGFMGGLLSLIFLRRIPEPAQVADTTRIVTRLRWRDVLADDPFRRLLLFSMSVQAFVASTATFVIVFSREQVDLQDGTILLLTAGASLVGILALALLRTRVDRLGSRPFLGVVYIWWIIYFASWFLLATGAVDATWLLAPLLLLMAGFFGSIYDLAITRLLMNTVGEHPATTQYFALHSVAISLLAGTAPILWGLLLDSLRGVQISVGGVEMQGFAVFFALQLLTLMFVLVALLRVHETSATSTRTLLYNVFIAAPSHRLAALVARLH